VLENWGDRALAKKWRKESMEEMQHADKLIELLDYDLAADVDFSMKSWRIP
jgi:bacterioferritin (cytochrome b1)